MFFDPVSLFHFQFLLFSVSVSVFWVSGSMFNTVCFRFYVQYSTRMFQVLCSRFNFSM
jgi:hypothetical protein